MARDETIKLSLIDGVTRVVGNIRSSLSGVASDLASINQVAELAGKTFRLFEGATAGVTDFEDALASLQAVTQASSADFDKLKQAAVDASERTRFSAIEAAQGLTELARAGFDATGAIEALNPTLALAQGQGLTVGESVQFLTTTLTQFGLAASEAGRVADVFASAADKSQLDVRQLASSMSYAAPIANQLGVSLEETTAIIGKLADEGFRGERGGTALTNAMTALLDPSSKFSKALDEAGIKTRNFTEVIQALSDKGDGAKKILLALDASATPAITALAKKGSDGINQLTKALREAEGAAQSTADKLGETLSASFDRLSNTLTNVRNEFLAPILAPLADELDAIATKLRAFAESEAFKQVSAEIQAFVVDGLREFEKFIAGIDFSTSIESARQFATQTRESLAQVREAFDITLTAGGNLSDGMSVAFNSAVSAISAALSSSVGAFAAFSDEAEALSVSLSAIADDSSIKAGDALGRIADRTRKAAEESDKAAKKLDSMRLQYIAATGPLNAFGKSLEDQLASTEGLAPAFDATRNSVMRLTEAQQKLTGAAQETQRAMTAATVAQYELQLRRLVDAQTALIASGQTSGVEFARLTAEIGAAERAIAELKSEGDKAGKTLNDVGNSANNAAGSMRNFAGAAGQAADAAQRVGSSNSQVSQSFGNIGQQAATAAADMGNMSQELLDLGIQMQSTARNGRDIIEVWEGINRRYEESNTRIQQEIDSLERRNRAVSEEAQIRRQLEQQYGTESTLLEKLVQLRLRDLQQRRQSVEATRELINVEQQLQAVRAGEFNANAASAASASEQARGGTGGRGTSANPGGRGPAAPVVVNINGLPGDRAGWQDAVSRFIVPELERINRLSR